MREDILLYRLIFRDTTGVELWHTGYRYLVCLKHLSLFRFFLSKKEAIQYFEETIAMSLDTHYTSQGSSC